MKPRLSVLGCALSIVVLALASSGCSKKRYKMPSGSMIPSIVVGEGVTADTSVKTPARGDVFVFKYPEHPEQSFVKRIVALPGDKVELKAPSLSINGKAIPTCVIGVYSYADDGTKHDGDLVLEQGSPSGYLVLYDKTSGGFGDGTWTVAAGEYFALGDNRNNSHDSRMWFGGKGGDVPQANLEGRVENKLVLPKGAEGLASELDRCKKTLGITP